LPPGAQKSAFRRETQSITPPQGHRVGIRSAGFGIASRRAAAAKILSMGVSNFAQTADARSGNF
jgi:hypothetical protein